MLGWVILFIITFYSFLIGAGFIYALMWMGWI